MNIEEIKRNLNRGVFVNDQHQPKKEIKIDVPKRSEQPKRSEPPKNLTKKDLANNLYYDESDEEDDKPQSQVWETEKENIDILQPVENIIETLELEDKKYDWRYKTKKGKQSRKNFTELLKVSL